MSKNLGRGRPKKEIAFDPEEVKQYIQRLFTIMQEIKTLQEGKKDLREEYKDKVDMKLVNNVVRLIKAQLKLTASPETVEELSDIIKDKINMVME